MIRPFLFAPLALACASPLQAEIPRGTYRGTAATTVKFLDPITNAATATRRYSRKITVVIGKPAAGETNLFSLNVKPTIVGPQVAGDFHTASARLLTSGGSTRLLQYWSLANTATGFTGEFTNSHILDGAAIDRVVAPLVRPSGPLKGYRFHDDRVSDTFQVTATAVSSAVGKLALTIGGYGFVPNKAGIQFTAAINAKKPPQP